MRLHISELAQVIFTGDPHRLQQLLLNLVDHALRHTPPAGTVTLDLQAADRISTLTVSDTGAGIAPEDLPRIFDHFYRADPARTHLNGTGSTGLGLAICKQIAEAHGGRIEVESTPIQGSTFTVTLPTTAHMTQ